MIDDKFSILITKQDVQEYANSVDEKEGIYFSEEEAKQHGFASIPLPPSMPFLFLKPQEGLFHGVVHRTQAFDYKQPLYIDTSYICEYTFEEVKRRHGYIFYEQKLTIFNEKGNQVATCSSTLIKGERE
ncbi:FAS1-like dehydratase domain-containing protein [Priestia endophytica]|jgi:hypothetical protein|uniref:N-terminal half of MaoC dehydratase n=1 Tax=Priestia endophytica DSM 13796 TaxID=1121089 RepID=A0A1I6ACS6_9BACI|nr:MaoC family dehydratase N-terminal domain-containing protein [Priestia endophytica]KYG27369.1 hypothetical protein AZF06_14235 [Priestia endophytica]RAS86807.1 hypothetical protein A4R27_00310 [Priestia endophytica]SFQ66420.1 N-terminal half of MaoC dehydratase [Priestia endophytica DSM 13796]